MVVYMSRYVCQAQSLDAELGGGREILLRVMFVTSIKFMHAF